MVSTLLLFVMDGGGRSLGVGNIGFGMVLSSCGIGGCRFVY